MDDWDRLKMIFDQAVALPLGEREEFVWSECNGDLDLQAQIADLLRADEEAVGRRLTEGFLEARIDCLDEVVEDHSTSLQGHRLGHYRLGQFLGEGGMGTVYLAEQEGVARKVALKIIKGASFSPERRSRFQLEARILGRLRHPGIAQIFEADTHTTTLGEIPYIAMEYVEGRSVTQYAREENLMLVDRLQLLGKIASAVEHAHRKGIVHRDLKPENIVVDKDGSPRVLDFGIARTVEEEGESGSNVTAAGRIMGTPLYMSPEQCRGDQDSIDIRTDIYALGVVAYELLTRQPPWKLENIPVLEAIRIVQESPVVPAGRVNSKLKGDLENLIAKAMDKDPERRYRNASELQRDIENYLRNEPLLAAPTSHSYRIKKFVKRNRKAVLVAAITLLVLVSSFAAVVRSWLGEREAKAELVTVNQEINHALSFLKWMLTSADPSRFGRDVTVLAMVQRAYTELNERSPGSSRYTADLMITLGDTCFLFGDFRIAKELYESAHEILVNEYGVEDVDTLRAARAVALVMGRTEHAREGEIRLRSILVAQADSFGSDHPETLRTRLALANQLSESGSWEEAESLLAEVVAGWRSYRGTHQEDLARALIDLGSSRLSVHQDAVGAEPFLSEAEELILRTQGADSLEWINVRSMMARVRGIQRRTSEALAIYREVFESRLAILGPESDVTAITEMNLAGCLWDNGRFDEAEAHLRSALEGLDRILGPNASRTQYAAECLDEMLGELGKDEEREVFRGEWSQRVDGKPFTGIVRREGMRLPSPRPMPDGLFGSNATLEEDTLVVSASGESNFEGACYVFHFVNGNWVEQQRLIHPEPTEGDRFGQVVALSGDYLAIGAPGDDHKGKDAGSILVYSNDGTGWSLEQRVYPADLNGVGGYGYALSLDRDLLVAGEYCNCDGGEFAGRLHVYRLQDNKWAEETTFIGDAGDQLGRSVLVRGDLLIASAPMDDHSDGRANVGAAWVYRFSDGGWAREAKLFDPEGRSGDDLGLALAIDGDTVVAGAFAEDSLGESAGAVVVFRFDSGRWSFEEKIFAPDGVAGDTFGSRTALADETLLVSAAKDDHAGLNTGSVYVFQRTAVGWTLREKLLIEPSDWNQASILLSVDAGRVVIGTNRDDKPQRNSGSVHIFSLQGK